MKRLLLLPILALLCMQACKKDDPVDEPKAVDKPADYFFPLKVGNYWVYETLDVQNNLVSIDTIKIEADTIVNGKTFYVFNSLFPAMFVEGGKHLITDSAGYIIDESGYKYAISAGERDTLSQEDFVNVKVVIKGGVADTTINTQIGSFLCSETLTDVYYYKPSYVSPTGNNVRYTHEYWSINIGCIKRNYFYPISSHDYIVILKSYHLEP